MRNCVASAICDDAPAINGSGDVMRALRQEDETRRRVNTEEAEMEAATKATDSSAVRSDLEHRWASAQSKQAANRAVQASITSSASICRHGKL